MSRAQAHVYAFVMGEQIKVGRSERPWRRLEIMRRRQGGLGLAMVYCTDPIDQAVLVEFRAHQILGAHRLDGEWFNVEASDAEAAIKQAIKDVKQGWRFPAIRVRGGMARHRDALAVDCPAVRRRQHLPRKDWPERWKPLPKPPQ